VSTVVALVLPWLAVLLYLVLNLFYLWPGRVHGEAPAHPTTHPEKEQT
jgi:hypothetical protein